MWAGLLQGWSHRSAPHAPLRLLFAGAAAEKRVDERKTEKAHQHVDMKGLITQNNDSGPPPHIHTHTHSSCPFKRLPDYHVSSPTYAGSADVQEVTLIYQGHHAGIPPPTRGPRIVLISGAKVPFPVFVGRLPGCRGQYSDPARWAVLPGPAGPMAGAAVGPQKGCVWIGPAQTGPPIRVSARMWRQRRERYRVTSQAVQRNERSALITMMKTLPSSRRSERRCQRTPGPVG